MNNAQILKKSISTALLFFPVMLWAQDIQVKTIKFETGKSSAIVTGSITGYQTIDYKISANAGQTLKVSLKTSKTSNNFNILPPGSEDQAIYNGSIEGTSYMGKPEQTGEYKIRVYLERNDARRNATANFTLTVSVTN